MGVFVMPSLGADMEAGTLTEWLVAPGDTVARGDVVAVVETQKGAIEIEVFETGKVQELKAEIGQTLPVGAPLAVILGEGEAATAPAAPAMPVAPEPAAAAEAGPAGEPPPVAPEPALPVGTVQEAREPGAAAKAPTQAAVAAGASPAARRAAERAGLDLSAIRGSGPGGAVVLADVETFAAAGAAAPPKPSAAAEMRKAVAAAMTRSKREIPHFYLSHSVDVTPAEYWIAAENAARPPTERLLLGALLAKAAARAAQTVGTVNGHYLDGGFRPAAQVNIGVAVALRGGGLVAPAIADAANLPLDAVMAALRDMVSRARAGRLRGSELTSGTITLSSLGAEGAEAMTGVIFPPQVALIGTGAPQLRPWVVDDRVVPRRVLAVTLSADHRVCDGRQAAAFLTAFESQIMKPEAL